MISVQPYRVLSEAQGKPICDYTETLYKKQWTIETAYRGLKTARFNMKDFHLDEERFRNMLRLLMIAFAAAFIKGPLRIQTLPIPPDEE